MRFIEKTQLENVQTVLQVYKDNLFYISRDLNMEQIILDDNFSKSFICSNVIDARLYKNQLHISVKGDGSAVASPLMTYNINSGEKVVSHTGADSNFSVNKNDCEIIYSRKDAGDNFAIYNYNICDGTDEFIMPGKLLYNPFCVSPLVITRTAVGSYPDHLTAYNVDERKVEWEFDVREIGKYYNGENKMWVHGEILQVAVVDNRAVLLVQLKLIALDLATGSIMWIKEFDTYAPRKFEYNESTGELLLYNSEEFAFLDPATGNVLRASVAFYEACTALEIRTYNFTFPKITEKYIYITFCLDRQIWIVDKHDFSIKAVINMNAKDIISQTSPPIIYGDLVLQQSMDRVLHVYNEVP